IFFRKDELYAIRDQELTTTRLTDLGVFRFVNVEFIEVQKGNQWYLDVVIRLLPSLKQAINWDLEAYTSSGFIGSEVGLTYQNKNLFKYTDLFVWNLRLGAETLTGSGEGSLGINTLDFSTDASIFFPKFLLPFYEVERVSRVA